MIRLVARKECFTNCYLAHLVASLQQAHEIEPEWRDPLTIDEKLSKLAGSTLLLQCRTPTLAEFPSTLGQVTARLMDALGIESLLAVMMVRCSWLAQRNDYAPVKAALERIEQWLGSECDFEGGLLADRASMTELLETIFWLSRCCASLPDIYLAPPKEAFAFSVCKHGVLHLEPYSSSQRILLCGESSKLGFRLLTRGSSCDDSFSDIEGPAIPGRKIEV